MKIAIFGPNLRDQSKGSFHVHAADCRDCSRYEDRDWSTEADTYEDVAREIYSDQMAEGLDIEDALHDIHFLPCTNGLRNEVSA